MFGVLERIKYINHLGEELFFGRDGLYVNESDIHSFSWTVASVNNKISGFDRGLQTKTVPVRVLCASKAEGIYKRNRLFEIPEKDVLANQYGRLVVDGYYCECFITESKKSRYSLSEKYMESDLTIVTDKPVWIMEEKIEILRDPSWRPIRREGSVATYDYDLPLDFPFDLYPTADRLMTTENHSFTDSNFRMVIYGAVVNPTLTINDHIYQVNVSVGDTQQLVIDSFSQKIMLDDESVFDARNRDDYIFEKIPTGELDIMWDNSFSCDLYLYDERSEPKWRQA